MVVPGLLVSYQVNTFTPVTEFPGAVVTRPLHLVLVTMNTEESRGTAGLRELVIGVL